MKTMTKTNTLTEIGETVADNLADAWAATAAFAHDLATAAVETAGELTSVASDGVSEGVDRVSSLYEQARHQIRPPRRRTNPWLFVAAALAGALAVGWWMRRRRDQQQATPSGVAPSAGHDDALQAAVGS